MANNKNNHNSKESKQPAQNMDESSPGLTFSDHPVALACGAPPGGSDATLASILSSHKVSALTSLLDACGSSYVTSDFDDENTMVSTTSTTPAYSQQANTTITVADKQKEVDIWKAKFEAQKSAVSQAEGWKKRAEKAEAANGKKDEAIARYKANDVMLRAEKSAEEKKVQKAKTDLAAKDLEIEALGRAATKEAEKQKTRDEKKKKEYVEKEMKKREIDEAWEKKNLGMHLD